ncbi:hypothetical protein T05_5174, partial [Trichinella murrelli]
LDTEIGNCRPVACRALRNVVAVNGRSILHQVVLKEDIFCNGNRFPLHLFSSAQSTISKVIQTCSCYLC